MKSHCIRLAVFAGFVAALGLGARAAHACSTFCFEGDAGPVFGKNYDWHISDGLVMVNKRGVAKTARGNSNMAEWTSRHGSVTFNQYGRDWPSGGMNEAGLVIELMWLDDTQYPAADKRAQLGSLEWIQYQLDNCATIDEVVATDRDIRISRQSRGLVHYLLSDHSGEVASVEFIRGEMVVNRGGQMPAKVLTNTIYARSAESLRKYDGFGGSWNVPKTRGSVDRFVRAADLVSRYDDAKDAVDYAFDVLRRVDQGEYTQWSIVYDIEGRTIHFRTQESAGVRSIAMARFDFSCDTPVQILDIDLDTDGDVTPRFVDYTLGANYQLMVRAFGGTPFLQHVPPSAIRDFAAYPEHTTCAQ